MNQKTKKKLISLLQLAIGIGLIVLIFFKIENKSDLLIAVRTAARHWDLLLSGTAGFVLCIFYCTLRWKLLLDAQGLKLSLGRALVLYFVGHFFNSFLFGVTGGDFVKAYFVYKEAPNKKTEAVSTVFLDRIVGLLALILLTVIIMAIRLPFFLTCKETRLALAFNVILLIAVVGGLFVVFRQNLFERWAFFRRLEQKTSLGQVVSRVYNAFHLCLNHPGLLFKTIVLSLVNHIWLIMCIFFLGMALEIHLPLADYITVFLIIDAVAAIPLTPGGLGTREAATIFLLGVLDVPETRALSLSLLIYATIMVWSLVGGIIYLFYSYSLGQAPSTLTTEDRGMRSG